MLTANISHCNLTRDVSSQETAGQLEKLENGSSAEGTAGSGSFGDEDVVDELLFENVADFGDDFRSFDDVPTGRKTSLTPLSLEVLNANQLDRRECVRSYIQTWSPQNLPVVGPVDSTSSQSYQRCSSVCEESRTSLYKPRELHKVYSRSFGEFYQHQPRPVSKPFSDNWDLFKNDRAPWTYMGSSESEEVFQGREGLLKDDQNSSWRMTNGDHESRHDPNKELKICSLSTINEESDGADRIELL